MRVVKYCIGSLLILLCINSCSSDYVQENIRPPLFVDIKEVVPDIALDIRYYTHFNFVGAPIEGYLQPKCLLTQLAAEALKQVQKELKKINLSLKIYDCYRPQRAVDHFVSWAKDLEDTRMKPLFYPRVEKKNLFKQGYIAAKSGHSRGSTVDLTMEPIAEPQQQPYSLEEPYTDHSIAMGTPFDYFDPLSHTGNPQISSTARSNRQLLKSVMERHGFKNLPEEWWHYTLKAEPFPDTYFNFPVE